MHERSAPGNADLIPLLREDILAAIGKHIPVDSDRVQVRVERGDAVSLLEIDIEISTLAQHLFTGARLFDRRRPRSITAPAPDDFGGRRKPRLPASATRGACCAGGSCTSLPRRRSDRKIRTSSLTVRSMVWCFGSRGARPCPTRSNSSIHWKISRRARGPLARQYVRGGRRRRELGCGWPRCDVSLVGLIFAEGSTPEGEEQAGAKGPIKIRSASGTERPRDPR